MEQENSLTLKESAAIDFACASASLHYYSCHTTPTSNSKKQIDMLKLRVKQYGELAGFSEEIINKALKQPEGQENEYKKPQKSINETKRLNRVKFFDALKNVDCETEEGRNLVFAEFKKFKEVDGS